MKTAVRTVSQYFRVFDHFDNRDFRYEATLSVGLRWFLLVGCLIEANYRIEYGALSHVLNVLYLVAMLAFNGYVHYRLRSGRRVSIGWLCVLSTMDIAAISFSVSQSGGFDSRYYALYYPAAVMFAWVLTSPYPGFIWVTMVTAIYATLCLNVGTGLDFDQQQEKVLFYRILALYAVVGFANVLTRFERARRLEATERELEMRQERIEISQVIHDTVAQSVYLVGLGVETARDLARETNGELAERLDAIHGRARMAMWELRHPIDSTHIFEAPELTEALSSHAASFTAITDLPSEVVQAGDEPDLSPLTRGLLFSIAHNAMTNVLLHAQASQGRSGPGFPGRSPESVSIGRRHRDARRPRETGPRAPQHGRQRAAHGRTSGGVARYWRGWHQSNLRSPLRPKWWRYVECQREFRSE